MKVKDVTIQQLNTDGEGNVLEVVLALFDGEGHVEQKVVPVGEES